MKQVAGTFFNDKEEDFRAFIKLFEDGGYEVARQGIMLQAVVIKDDPEEKEVEENQN